ncbi:hypothetical protein HO133_000923 [Letharia lupina]|uniref:Uncharacterized protein n=1 Tax=Letharia lupina TaxID=560253 RepID=A0A8H6CG29_9LECA|nr:uncharacterized protein HO133_000923 [Letharia lupina]KAF6222872.1 hypothetical protein HO133_000923 [Letharia lupina]
MKITKGLKWNQQDGLMTAFHHFEPGLQRDLDPPNAGLTHFIKQVQLRQGAWYQVYSTFGKPRPPDPYSNRPHQVHQSRPQQSYQQQPPRPPYRQSQPQLQPQPTRPQVYWGEEEEDYMYDAPADSYHVAPTYHPAGHTPRRHGNTHDEGGNEAMVHWAATGEDHRCSHEGCTHYH